LLFTPQTTFTEKDMELTEDIDEVEALPEGSDDEPLDPEIHQFSEDEKEEEVLHEELYP